MSGITILYGSETGTAEDVSYGLLELLTRHTRCGIRVFSMDDFDVSNLSVCEVVIFIVSTTGDGDAPGNMKRSWEFLLRKSLSSTWLKDVKTAVFGLGDSSYEKFNAAARRLFKRLQQLGSPGIVPIGLGDDQARFSYLTALDAWQRSLLEALKSIRSLEAAIIDQRDGVDLGYTVDVDAHSQSDPISLAWSRPHGLRRSSSQVLPYTASVEENRRLTDPSWAQNVCHVILRIPLSLLPPPPSPVETATVTTSVAVAGVGPAFEAGDIAVIHPKNPPQIVQRALRLAFHDDGSLIDPLVSLNITRLQTVNPRSSRTPSLRITATELLTSVLDLCGGPRRSFFAALAPHATNDEEREKLEELSSGAGTSLYYDYCVLERRHYIDVLEDFRSARPSLSKLLSMIPIMTARQYSIASSGIVQPDKVDLCVAVAERTSKYGRKWTGLCSGYLSSLSVGDSVTLWIRRGLFTMPPSSTPLVLVGPGTGFAPMRSAIMERKQQIRSLASAVSTEPSSSIVIEEATSMAPCLAFFGCRKRRSDFLYSHEWIPVSEGEEDGSGSEPCLFHPVEADVEDAAWKGLRLITAFSQDQTHKVYVSTKIMEHGKDVNKALLSGGVVFISGSAKSMPANVKSALAQVLVKFNAMQQRDADLYIKQLEREKRLIVEAWS